MRPNSLQKNFTIFTMSEMKFILFILIFVSFSFSANEADEYSSFLSTSKWGVSIGPSFHLDSTQDAIKISFQQKFLFTSQTAISYNIDWLAPKATIGGNFLLDIVAFHYKKFTPNINLGVSLNHHYRSSQPVNIRNIRPYLVGMFGFLFQISKNTTIQIRVPCYFGLNREIFDSSSIFRNNQDQRIGLDLGILFSSSYTHVRKWIP